MERLGSAADDFAEAVARGLAADEKSLPCRFFYDREGALLFEAICAQPEYYPPRAEGRILEARAGEIVARMPPGATLVELGNGNGEKTRHLIEAFLLRQPRLRYVAVDISQKMLEASSLALELRYPRLDVLALAAEYEAGLAALERSRGSDGPRLILWLGSNIGNFPRAAAAAFLSRLGKTLSAGDRLLVGIDLRKDPATLERAYDDARGVTARFNRNILLRINRELGGDFDVDAFAHRARYDDRLGRVQMHLVSARACRVSIAALSRSFDFSAGEAIHTEDSYKYSIEEIDALAIAAGLSLEARWLDPDHLFSENLFRSSSTSG